MNQNEMLDQAKKKLQIDQDQDLARALDVHQSTISKVRTGKTNLGPETALRLAEILEVDPARIAAAAYAARASTPKSRKAWERAATLCLAAAVIVGCALPSSTRAYAQFTDTVNPTTDHAKHYAIISRRKEDEPDDIDDELKSREKHNEKSSIRRARHTFTVAALARYSSLTALHNDQRAAPNRPVRPRPTAMESRVLRPRTQARNLRRTTKHGNPSNASQVTVRAVSSRPCPPRAMGLRRSYLIAQVDSIRALRAVPRALSRTSALTLYATGELRAAAPQGFSSIHVAGATRTSHEPII